MRARLAELASSGTPAVEQPAGSAASDERADWRRRVVLLDYFSAEALGAARGGFWTLPKWWKWGRRKTPIPPMATFIAEDCELVTTRDSFAWRLRLEVRRTTIASLGTKGLRDAIDAKDAVPPGPLDIAHAMARALLAGPVDLEALTPNELSGLLRAREWLHVLDLRLPPAEEVRTALDFANVLAPLHAVARADFVGRAENLAMLERYLGDAALAPDPLAIHGPGGVGKSALVAKFVLDRVVHRSDRLLFAYLSFDHSELNPEFPLSLVREATRQVMLQSPKVADLGADLIAEIDHQISTDVALRKEQSASRGNRSVDGARGTADQHLLLLNFAYLVRAAVGDDPLVLLLDTFEVAQRRHGSSLGLLDNALRELRMLLPAARIIVTGRAEASQITSKQEHLEGLGPEDARQLLRGAIGDLAISDELIDEVADRVEGNPLSLRLSAELMLREGAGALSSSRGRRRFLFELGNEQIQGILYRRILDHVALSVRPLANPGLVVRRITPEVIAEVLAVPCGLGTLSARRAAALFDDLRTEVSLVTEVTPGMLVHRSDVREQMLPLLVAEDADRVKAIHRRAVAYYSERGGDGDRVEELYHRLMLGQSSDTLDKHWDQFAGRSLETALREFPASSRVYVASKLEIEVDPADLTAADREAWVRQVVRQARRLLDAGKPDEVLAIIGTRGADAAQAPAVSLLWVEALALLNQPKEALLVADAAIASADGEGRLAEYAEISIVAGRVAEDALDLKRAADYFRDAYAAAVDAGQRTYALTAGAGVLRIARREGVRASAAVERVRQELVDEASRLTDHERSQNPGLLRELAAEIGEEIPGLLSDAAVYLGVDTTSKGDDLLSDRVRAVIDTTADQYVGASVGDPERVEGTPSPHSSAKMGKAISDALNDGPDDGLRSSVAEYFQNESDRPSYDARPSRDYDDSSEK